MKDTDYAFCVARVRAKESELLSADFINRLIEADNYDSVIRLLEGVGWIEADTSDKNLIKKQYDNLWMLLSESVPDKGVLNFLCVLNDYFNIKTAIKCILSGENADLYYVYPSSLELEKLCKSIDSRSFDVLKNENMRNAAKNAFETACATQKGQDAEIVIDVAALNALLEISSESRYNTFSKICSFTVDSSNIRTALRCAKNKKSTDFIASALSSCCKIDKYALVNKAVTGVDALCEYLATSEYSEGVELYCENPSHYDKWCDKKLLELSTNSSYTSFGFDPVCAYFYKKSNEIKNVKLILSAKKSGIPIDLLKERVTVTYA